ncbi:hypothetical protein [Methyloversatilis sp. XJ19-49]|uniref:hypothetical protein n=1 Tax=Methyloversatilis sp. XJ19-49 TaxID=2963429 RepID=UPI00211C0083|nr:hypothetical protein [Methyloversatilis sp. XJ19-49]MCQ9377334.1 hypothetical protein [Methyloversatilis sp. XJ19-49]
MSDRPTTIPEDRQLTEEERSFLFWLLSEGGDRSRAFLPQLQKAHVVGRCACGCPSINLSVGGVTHYGSTGMDTLCSYRWSSPKGHLFEVFVFACGGLLAGVDLWSIDGQSTPTAIPPTSALQRSEDW